MLLRCLGKMADAPSAGAVFSTSSPQSGSVATGTYVPPT